MAQFMIIDGEEYKVAIASLKRKGDLLDKYAYRSEDGELHREVIGTYYNYTLAVGIVNDLDLYNHLWDVLTEPTAWHDIVLPHDNVSFRGYFGSVQDEIDRIDYGKSGKTRYKGLTCNLVAVSPARRPTRRGTL